MTHALDYIAPSFRRALNRWPDAPNIRAHYDDLSQTFENNGSSLIELCKSFLEMVCITVINEVDEELPISSKPTTTEYLGSAFNALGIRNERGSSAIGKIISGHNKVADGLTAVRNHDGSVAHGKDGFIDEISINHARVYLLSADSIISLLLQAYEGVEPSILTTREPYGRFEHHNSNINKTTQVESSVDDYGVIEVLFRTGSSLGEFSLRAPASELLYYLDRQAYVDVLDALERRKHEKDETPEFVYMDIETSSRMKIAEKGIKYEIQQKKLFPEELTTITDYQGIYSKFISPLYEFILHSILNSNSEKADQVQNLTYTLLSGMEDLAVVDWDKRHSTRSEVRLFIKKLLKIFSIDGIEEMSIDQIIEWLAQRISGDE